MTERILMSMKDIEKIEVLNKVKERTIKQVSAAKILNITTRHLRRLLGRLNEDGPQGIVSRKIGIPGNNQLPQEAKDRILDFFKDEDHCDFGPTLTHEYLAENGAICSVSSVRNVMIRNGLWQPKAIRKLNIPPLRDRP